MYAILIALCLSQADDLQAIADGLIASRDKELASLAEERREAARAPARERRDKIAAIDKRIDELKAGVPIPEIDAMNPRDKTVGGLSAEVGVLSVMGEGEILVQPYGIQIRARPGTLVFDSSEVTGEPLILRGLPSRSYVDGQRTKFEGVFRVNGTESYVTTIGGKKTVFVLEALDGKRLRELLAAAGPAEEDPMPKVRTWTDATGTFTVDAEFLDYADGVVKLRKVDGSEASVPLERLSDSDQRWVRQELRRRARR